MTLTVNECIRSLRIRRSALGEPTTPYIAIDWNPLESGERGGLLPSDGLPLRGYFGAFERNTISVVSAGVCYGESTFAGTL